MRDHHEFARLLKITDKPDGYSTAARTEAENKALTDFVDRVLQEPSGAHLVPFWARMTAAYLPQLRQTYITYPFDLSPTSTDGHFAGDFDEWAYWLISILLSTQTNRFVRERPDDALAVEQGALERIASFPVKDVMACATDACNPVLSHIDWAFRMWFMIHEVLTMHLPRSRLAAHVDARAPRSVAVSQRLNALLPALVRLKDSRADKYNKDLGPFLQRYGGGTPGTHLPTIVDELRRSYARWWVCEAAVDEYGERPADAACERYKEGREMDACGKCGAVRYCSKAHQRAHWSTHKLVCVQPRW